MSYEDGFVHLANRIEPDDGLRDKVLALGEKAPKRRKKTALKFAVSFVLVATVLAGGALILPQNLAGLGKKAAQTGFTVYVEADENGVSSEVPMTPNRSFTICNDDPRYTRSGSTGLKEKRKDGRYDVSLLYILKLKCSADGLNKVIYSTNSGSFDRAVPLTTEQLVDEKYRKEHNLENILIGDGTVSYGYAICGKKLSLNCGKDYDGILGLKYTKTWNNYSSDWEWNLIHKQGIKKYLEVTHAPYVDDIRNTKLKITAVFSDGSTCEKTVSLSTENGFFITATLQN